jgi:hypothetical protein
MVRRGIKAELHKLSSYSGSSGLFRPHVDTPKSEVQIGVWLFICRCLLRVGSWRSGISRRRLCTIGPVHHLQMRRHVYNGQHSTAIANMKSWKSRLGIGLL